MIPAHAGDVTKVFLVKRQIPDSSYPAVTSSFLVQTVFDTSVGILVLLYAITQGLLPPLPELPHLPAFEVSFWANHPKTLAITVGVLILLIAFGIWLLAQRVRRFWARVRQGLVILSRPGDYMKQVFAWQGVGWIFRFAAFWFFLEAFGLKGSIGNVMLVMSVQAIANIVPFTPGGAGAQQALLVATLTGPSRAAVLSFSVGTQIAMAAWSVFLGFAAILLVFRTTDWRGLMKQAQEDQDGEDGGGDGGSEGAAGCERRRDPQLRVGMPSRTSRGSELRRAIARAGLRRRGSRSGRGRGGSRGGPASGLGSRALRCRPRRRRRRRWRCVGRRSIRASAGTPSRWSSTVPSERRWSSSWVKTVVRRLEEVRWGPAATAQLSLRQ